MSYPKYQEYKDSGVEWVAEVPDHWQVLQLKRIASHNDEVLPENTPSDFELWYVEISDVDEVAGIRSSSLFTFEEAPSRARRIVRDGDVLVSTVRTYLRAIAPVMNASDNLVASTGFAVIRADPVKARQSFLSYALRDATFIAQVIANSVGVSYPAINAMDLMRIKLPLPPLSEQDWIATFLDYETARIDALIAEQQRLIELLQEKRQAVISQAVTKGLDPSVPMKDSGVEWLGEVPEHWGVFALKRSVDGCVNGVWGDEPDGYSDIAVIRAADFDRALAKVGLEKLTLRSVTQRERESRLLKSGDLLIEKSGGGEKTLVGSVVLFDHEFEAVTSNFVGRMRPLAGFNSDFLCYAFHALFSARVNYPSVKQTTGIQNLDVESYLQERFCFPPQSEQAQIARFLKSETRKLDELVDRAMQTSELLTERRSALISAAVTGKIDVRNWQPPIMESESGSQDLVVHG